MAFHSKASATRRPANASSPRFGLLAESAFGAGLIVVAYAIYFSRLLRPIADDYAFAVTAQLGAVGAVVEWWHTWSGALAVITLQNLLVGMPALHLSWTFASSVPFAVTSLVLVGWSFWLLHLSGGLRDVTSWSSVRLLAAAILSWWGFWWLPVLVASESDATRRLAFSVTHWQTVVVGYVMATVLIAWGWMYLETCGARIGRLAKSKYFALGLLTGFSSFVLAVAALLTTCLLLVFSVLSPLDRSGARITRLIVGGSGILLGVAINYLSPGSQIRATYFDRPQLDSALAYRVLTHAIPRSFIDFLGAVFHPGAFAVILTLFAATALGSRRYMPQDSARLARSGAVLLGLSWCLYLVMRVSQYFSYNAFWHEVGPRTVVWMGLVAVGMSAGVLLAGRDCSQWKPFIVAGALVGTCLCSASVYLMTEDIRARSHLWEVGPAPLLGIADIEDQEGWIFPLWNELSSLRDVPNRTDIRDH